MSSPPKPTASSKLDLDDLFQDYYFNDFAQHPAPVGIFTDGAAPYDDKTPPSFSTTNSLSSMTSAIPFAPGQANPNYNPNNATPTMRAATKPTPTPSSNEPEDDFESEENDNGNDDDEDYTEKSSRRQSTRKKPAATKKSTSAWYRSACSPIPWANWRIPTGVFFGDHRWKWMVTPKESTKTSSARDCEVMG